MPSRSKLVSAVTLAGVLIGVVLGWGDAAAAARNCIQRVNTDASGVVLQLAGYPAYLSEEGRYVTFSTDSAGVYLKDMQTGAFERVSVGNAGEQFTGFGISGGAMSADARYVAFTVGTTPNAGIYVRDRQAQTTELLSETANAVGYHLQMTPDGRFVTFQKWCPGCPVFVHDRVLNLTEQVSVASDGTPANSDSYQPRISDDGRYVAFNSAASNLVAGDTNGQQDVFVRDRVTAVTTRVSVNTAGQQADNGADQIDMTGDGAWVTFPSRSNNLDSGSTPAIRDVYLHSMVTGETRRVSTTENGDGGNGISYGSAVGSGGRYVAFDSQATDLVGAPPPEHPRDIFLKDMLTNTTRLISMSLTGLPGDGANYDTEFSRDGSHLVFLSSSSDLVPNDVNGETDFFWVPTSCGAPPVGGTTPTTTATSTSTPTPTRTNTPTNTPTPPTAGAVVVGGIGSFADPSDPTLATFERGAEGDIATRVAAVMGGVLLPMALGGYFVYGRRRLAS